MVRTHGFSFPKKSQVYYECRRNWLVIICNPGWNGLSTSLKNLGSWRRHSEPAFPVLSSIPLKAGVVSQALASGKWSHWVCCSLHQFTPGIQVWTKKLQQILWVESTDSRPPICGKLQRKGPRVTSQWECCGVGPYRSQKGRKNVAIQGLWPPLGWRQASLLEPQEPGTYDPQRSNWGRTSANISIFDLLPACWHEDVWAWAEGWCLMMWGSASHPEPVALSRSPRPEAPMPQGREASAAQMSPPPLPTQFLGRETLGRVGPTLRKVVGETGAAAVKVFRDDPRPISTSCCQAMGTCPATSRLSQRSHPCQNLL